MAKGPLGTTYRAGEVILSQGDESGGMHVIQDGDVDVLHNRDGREVQVSVLRAQDFFGEIPFFERLRDPGVARATFRARSDVTALTIDKKTIVKRIHEDPSLAYRIMETMSRRMRELEEDLVRLLVAEDQKEEGESASDDR